jgi:hypothetical protein
LNKSDLRPFRWDRPERGYRLLLARESDPQGRLTEQREATSLEIEGSSEIFQTSGVWVIADGSSRSKPCEMLAGHPFEKQGALFMRFAGIQPNPRGILDFANEYGCLGIDDYEDLITPLPNRRLPKGDGLYCERLEEWFDEIFAMRSATKMWRAAKNREENKTTGETLAGLIKYRPTSKTVVYPDSYPSPTSFAPGIPRLSSLAVVLSDDSHSELLGQIARFGIEKYLVELAYLYVQKLINRGLRTTDLGQRRSRAFAELSWKPRQPRPTLSVAPDNLLGGLWLQFAEAVSGNKSFRSCPKCGKLIELSLEPSGFRSDALFCSDQCRTKDYRDRKNLARELAAQGHSEREIAAQVRSTEATVHKWLLSGGTAES